MIVTLLLNTICPGLGSIVIGHWVQGVLQVLMTLVAFVLLVSVFLTFFGLVLYALVWIYAFILWVIYFKNNRRKTASA